MNMILLWAIAAVVFAVLEGVTAQLVSIWFVTGSVAALIAAVCGAPIWLQAVLFFAVSLSVLALVRPMIKKQLKTVRHKTNADRCIGQQGVVLEAIDNLHTTGQVKVDGKVWTARSSDNSIIPKDSLVTVDKIDGVKLIVTPTE